MLGVGRVCLGGGVCDVVVVVAMGGMNCGYPKSKQGGTKLQCDSASTYAGSIDAITILMEVVMTIGAVMVRVKCAGGWRRWGCLARIGKGCSNELRGKSRGWEMAGALPWRSAMRRAASNINNGPSHVDPC